MTAAGWLGVIAFVLGLLISVMIHEWGHFAAARRFGCKVTEFFVGFGTRLWSVRRGETEYGLKAIPAGGYVKIVGMTDLEPIPPEDEPRAFYRRPAWQRAVTLSAGSFMHLVIGFVLFFAAYTVFGDPVSEARLGSISACVPATDTATCASDSPVSPAKRAGLQAGDRVVSVDGRSVATWNDLTDAIRSHPGQEIVLVVDRGGVHRTVAVTTDSVTRKAIDDPTKEVTVGAIGIAPPAVATQVRSNPVTGVGKAAQQTWDTLTASVGALVTLPVKLVQLTGTLITGGQRDPNGAVGVVGLGKVSGDVAQANDLTPAGKISLLLTLLAAVNIFIGVFNMLPLLPLDGGHVAVLAWERLRAWRARRQGLPEPARPDLNKLLPLAYAVLFVFVGMSLLLLLADIVKPIQI
jgi:membrane-associated protease RseP (regulator of RpoE activity)